MNKTRNEGFRKTILLEKQKNFFFLISSTGPVIVTDFITLLMSLSCDVLCYHAMVSDISNATQRESIGSQWALVEKVTALKGKFLRPFWFISQ